MITSSWSNAQVFSSKGSKTRMQSIQSSIRKDLMVRDLGSVHEIIGSNHRQTPKRKEKNTRAVEIDRDQNQINQKEIDDLNSD